MNAADAIARMPYGRHLGVRIESGEDGTVFVLQFRDDLIEEEDGEVESEPAAIGQFDNQLIQADTQLDYAWREVSITTIAAGEVPKTALSSSSRS